MATYITEECINCGACEPECPNEAISEGDDIYVIDPKLCTECVGFHDHEACQAVCPVECCLPDPNNVETEEALLTRAKRSTPTRSSASPSRRVSARAVRARPRMPGRGLIVAIDGPAGAGESTAARLLRARLGYALLDTGAIYRPMALRARERGVAWDDGPGVAALANGIDIAFRLEGAVNHVTSSTGEDVSAAIRTPEMSDGASRVSALPEVRAALLGLQRRIGARGGVVVEGRDIGTVVFPDAEAKFFLTASTDERARRRMAAGRAERSTPGVAATTRATRAAAPLRKADDASRSIPARSRRRRRRAHGRSSPPRRRHEPASGRSHWRRRESTRSGCHQYTPAEVATAASDERAR